MYSLLFKQRSDGIIMIPVYDQITGRNLLYYILLKRCGQCPEFANHAENILTVIIVITADMEKKI